MPASPAYDHFHMAASLRVIVLGASVESLACACELAIAGARVTLVRASFDLRPRTVFKVHGFAFESCEKMITRPDVLHDLFSRAGRVMEDYLTLIEVDPFMRFFFDDGVTLNLRRNAGLFALQLDQQFPLNRQGANYCDLITARRDGKRRIAKDILRRAVSEPHVAQLCAHVFDRWESWDAKAVDGGMWYSFGGVRQVAFALERLAAELGVEFVLSGDYKTMHGNTLVAINVDGRVMQADVVIDGGEDFWPSHHILLLGINRRYPHLALHNTFVMSDGKEIFVTAPCALDPAHAPVGGDALRVDFPNIHGDIEQDRSAALAQLAKFGMGDIKRRTVVEQYAGDVQVWRDAGMAARQGVDAAQKILTSPPDERRKIRTGIYTEGKLSGVRLAQSLAMDEKIQCFSKDSTTPGSSNR